MPQNAAAYLDSYREAARITDDKRGLLFRSAAGKTRQLTYFAMDQNDRLRMIQRPAQKAGVSERVGGQTFRATGIQFSRQE